MLTTLWLFVMRLSHSGKAFHVAVATQAQEAFLEGHVAAFAYFGGVPARIRYDNLKPAVIRVLRGRERTESERFIALRSHYGYDSFFCIPGIGGAHEKVWVPRNASVQFNGHPRAAGHRQAGSCSVLLRLAYLAVSHAFAALRLVPISDHEKDIEILALRHQLGVLQRQLAGRRPRLRPEDGAFLAALLVPLARSTLRRLRLLVSPDAVLR